MEREIILAIAKSPRFHSQSLDALLLDPEFVKIVKQAHEDAIDNPQISKNDLERKIALLAPIAARYDSNSIQNAKIAAEQYASLKIPIAQANYGSPLGEYIPPTIEAHYISFRLIGIKYAVISRRFGLTIQLGGAQFVLRLRAGEIVVYESLSHGRTIEQCEEILHTSIEKAREDKKQADFFNQLKSDNLISFAQAPKAQNHPKIKTPETQDKYGNTIEYRTFKK